MKPQKSLRARAMDILSQQEISRVGLKRKLAPYAESEEELENVLNEFAERNWQSDQRYAEAYIHSKSRQHGSLRLKQALAQQGIDETVSREFMPDKTRELQTAVAVLRKRKQIVAALAGHVAQLQQTPLESPRALLCLHVGMASRLQCVDRC